MNLLALVESKHLGKTNSWEQFDLLLSRYAIVISTQV